MPRNAKNSANPLANLVNTIDRLVFLKYIDRIEKDLDGIGYYLNSAPSGDRQFSYVVGYINLEYTRSGGRITLNDIFNLDRQQNDENQQTFEEGSKFSEPTHNSADLKELYSSETLSIEIDRDPQNHYSDPDELHSSRTLSTNLCAIRGVKSDNDYYYSEILHPAQITGNATFTAPDPNNLASLWRFNSDLGG